MITRVKNSSILSVDVLGFVNLLDVAGASADGVTDNYTAITAALATGLPVYIPPGTFVSSPFTMPANATMYGAGNTSILKLKTVANAAFITMGTNSTLSDLCIDGNKGNQVSSGCHGLVINNAVISTVTNVRVKSTKGDGVRISGSSTNEVILENVSVTGHTENGISVVAGINVTLSSCYAGSSDGSASPGNGFNIISDGSSVSAITLQQCTAVSNIGQGYAIKGFGSKNTVDVTLVGCLANSNTANGFHLQTTERVVVTNCIAKSNTIDGFRLEGDVQNSRLTTCIANGNTQYGFREVTSGSTPNFNGFVYEVSTNNGTNTVTKVGANSLIVSV